MKTRIKIIIIGIIITSIVFGTYQSIMYQCGTLPVFMETPRTPTLWKCLDVWNHQSEQSQQKILSDPICFVTSRISSGNTGSGVTLDTCITLEKFEEIGCTKPMLEHLNRHSNLLDYELEGLWYLEWASLPEGMSKEDFDNCIDVILEKRPILNPTTIPEPESLPANQYGKQINDIETAKKQTGLDWITIPNLPNEYSYSQILVDNVGKMVTLTYTKEQIPENTTLDDIARNGIVIVFSNNAGTKNWELYVEQRVKQYPQKYSSVNIENDFVLIASDVTEEITKAYLQKPPSSVTVMSGQSTFDELAKIAVSSFKH